MDKYIRSVIEEKRKCLDEFEKSGCNDVLVCVSERVVETLKNGHKILIAGNGGSAADAQHFAAELVGRFLTERKGLPAIALTTDTSILTSVANDYSFEQIFSRQIGALAVEGDLFIGISTSGNSENVLCAVREAKEKGIFTVGFLGKDGGKLKEKCDLSLIIPSNITAMVQEMHETCIHIICAFVDQAYEEA